MLETAQQVPGREARARPTYAPNSSLRYEPFRGSQALEQQQQEPKELWVTVAQRLSLPACMMLSAGQSPPLT